MSFNIEKYGIVIIGRNEGARLSQVLISAKSAFKYIVYVDSGSTDESIDIAKSHNIPIVSIDTKKPLSAARARNEGFQWITKNHPRIKYIQFLDGDCEIEPNWLETADNFLIHNQSVGIVTGILNEKYPDKSIYNHLCDIEWQGSLGEIEMCGGIMLINKDLFMSINGFDTSIIAAEDDDFCIRAREAGYRIYRLDVSIAQHDADISSFYEWWARSIRNGIARMLIVFKQGINWPYLRPIFSILVWGLIIPSVTIIFSVINPLFILVLLIYPMQWLRVAIRMRDRVEIPYRFSFFLLVTKFAETVGIIKFLMDKLKGQHSRLIDYKK